MYERAKQYTLLRPRLKQTVGVIMILAGVFGLIMPIIPGALFIVIGLEIFGLRLLFVDRLFERIIKKKPVATEGQP